MTICYEVSAMSSPSLARLIPALTWLRAYDRTWLRGDLLAGITLAAYLLPAALGDASLANLPPEVGLYACFFGGLIFWIFCGSRYTVVSVTSAISLVIGSSLGKIPAATRRASARSRPARRCWSRSSPSLHGSRKRESWSISVEDVMTGFKCGVALFLASTQLPKLFGFHSAHGSFWGNPGFSSNTSTRRTQRHCSSEELRSLCLSSAKFFSNTNRLRSSL